MSFLSRKLMMPSGGGLLVDDVFSTDLYTGNGTSQTITNGIDLAGEGGLVWVKCRDSARNNALHDTERGVDRRLVSDGTFAESAGFNEVLAFNSDGFGIGSGGLVNANTDGFAAWTFRKSPRFFDVVTYTGDGTSGRTIPHNLGVEPGMIVVKRRNSTGNWPVYHRANTAAPETDYLLLNTTAATADLNTYWNDTAPTASVFTLGNNADVNASGGTYVAYLFAHDTRPNGFIQCGSYTGNGSSTGPVINLGWEPQWLLIKQSDALRQWHIFDSERGFSNALLASNSSAEFFIGSPPYVTPSSTGFQITSSNDNANASGGIYIYMAIRKEEA